MINMTKQVSVPEALRLIESGQFSSELLVSFTETEPVEALDAVTLGSAGVDVPEELIYYADETIVEDVEFSGDWHPIPSDLVEESKFIRLEMELRPEVKEWLNSKEIDISLLVGKLLDNAYETAKLVG